MALSKKELRRRLREHSRSSTCRPSFVVDDVRDFPCGEILLEEPQVCILQEPGGQLPKRRGSLSHETRH